MKYKNTKVTKKKLKLNKKSTKDEKWIKEMELWHIQERNKVNIANDEKYGIYIQVVYSF